MPKLYCIVSASNEQEAVAEAERHLGTVMQVPKKYLKRLTPRRLKLEGNGDTSKMAKLS